MTQIIIILPLKKNNQTELWFSLNDSIIIDTVYGDTTFPTKNLRELIYNSSSAHSSLSFSLKFKKPKINTNDTLYYPEIIASIPNEGISVQFNIALIAKITFFNNNEQIGGLIMADYYAIDSLSNQVSGKFKFKISSIIR